MGVVLGALRHLETMKTLKNPPKKQFSLATLLTKTFIWLKVKVLRNLRKDMWSKRLEIGNQVTGTFRKIQLFNFDITRALREVVFITYTLSKRFP